MTRDNIDKTSLLSNAENMQSKTRRATNFIFVWSVNKNLHNGEKMRQLMSKKQRSLKLILLVAIEGLFWLIQDVL